MPDKRLIALFLKGKSGLYKDTVPGNSGGGNPGIVPQKINRHGKGEKVW